MPNTELSADELAFLSNAMDGPLLAFRPLNDPLIVDLLDRGLITLRPNSDPEHSLMDLTDAGRASVKRDLR